MKRLFMMGLTLTMATSAFATGTGQIGSVNKRNEELQITGFQILEDSDSLLKLKFRDDDKAIVLSKQKFSSEKDAKNFCEKNGVSLDQEGLATALLVAMSGAATADEKINDSVSFSFTVQGQTVGGIWAWTGKNDTVEVIQNGKGLSNETTPISEMAQVAKQLGLPELALVPAICK